MRRLLSLAGYAGQALARRRGRTLALLAALTVTSAASASVFFLGESLRAASDALLDRAPALTVQRLAAGRAVLIDEAELAPIGRLPSVRSVRPRVWGYVYQPALEGNLVVIGMDEAALAEAGAAGLPGTLGDDEVVVGAAFARSLGFRSGDRLALARPSEEGPLLLRIAHVLGEDTSLAFGDVLLASVPTARRILEVPDGFAVDAVVDVFPPQESGVVAEHVVETLPGARIVDREALRRRRALTFEARAGLMTAALLPLVLAFLVLVFDRLSGLAEGERREIGILKALGWSTADVLAARLVESVLVGALGASLGLLVGHLFVFELGAPGLSEAYFGWSNVRPPAVFAPASGDVVVLLFAVVLAPYAAASVVPAWRAAVLDPHTAIREGA